MARRSTDSQEEDEKRAIVLGNPNVGKTSILLRWSEERFEEEGPDNLTEPITKQLNLSGQQSSLTLTVCDTAGQEKLRTPTSSYFRDMDMVILVFSGDNEESWNDIPSWVNECMQYVEDMPIMLVCNKTDLERKVTKEQVQSYVGDNRTIVDVVETSAKTGENINKLFEKAANYLAYGDVNPNDEGDHTNAKGCCLIG
jgi:small GTP-binding protein